MVNFMAVQGTLIVVALDVIDSKKLKMTHYIKLIWGPGGPHYPGDDGRIGFSTESHAECFANCDGFFIIRNRSQS